MRGARLSPEAHHRLLFGTVVCAEDAVVREVVGFVQFACALTLGIAGGWAVHEMGSVMGWSGF
jgi:hypothetical protein